MVVSRTGVPVAFQEELLDLCVIGMGYAGLATAAVFADPAKRHA